MQRWRPCVLGVALLLACRGRAVEDVDRTRAVSDDPPRNHSARDAATPADDVASDAAQATGVRRPDAGPRPRQSDASRPRDDSDAEGGAGSLGDELRPISVPLDAGTVSDLALDALLNAPANALYGLGVGARWYYLRSRGAPRWKEITACEDVEVRDPDSGEMHVVRAYVRENWSERRLASVHYLTAGATGVHRVRRDDGRPLGSTKEIYTPPLLRLRGGHELGEEYEFTLQVDEYNPGWTLRTSHPERIVDHLRAPRALNVLIGRTDTLVMERTWESDEGVPGSRVESYYAPGIGEVYEQTTQTGVDYPATEIEELAWFVPGYGGCSAEDFGVEPVRAVDDPWIVCDNPWGIGRRGVTDPRLDAFNCGECDVACEVGATCAAGRCVHSEANCEQPCVGATLCCEDGGDPVCVAPGRDVQHCGECGNDCGLDRICDHGRCACPRGQADCASDGTCLDLLSDPRNCGECAHVCPGAERCEQGLCGECLAPAHEFCDGVCKDLLSDDDACGDCETRCGAGTGTLRCESGHCLPCAAEGLTNCEGTCEELPWSERHCGDCGHACERDEVCVFGECQHGDGSCAMTCLDDDQLCCDEACVDPRNNARHCGGCGAACTGAMQDCSNGECVPDNDLD